jgi:hypothetical protein
MPYVEETLRQSVGGEIAEKRAAGTDSPEHAASIFYASEGGATVLQVRVTLMVCF